MNLQPDAEEAKSVPATPATGLEGGLSAPNSAPATAIKPLSSPLKTPLNTGEQAFLSYIPTLKVLNVGCGNSILPEEMYDTDGYREIYNMDISSPCINKMKERNQERRPELIWQVMDCTNLEYEDEFFDLIIDKSTIDSLVCGSQAYKKVSQLTREC